jgi:hypothetical protein
MLKLMITFVGLVALSILPVTVGVNLAVAEDGIVLKEVAMLGEEYCHIKYEAFKVGTLSFGNPEAEFDPDDIVDFYGSCDFNPRSKEEVQRQMADLWRSETDGSTDD